MRSEVVLAGIRDATHRTEDAAPLTYVECRAASFPQFPARMLRLRLLLSVRRPNKVRPRVSADGLFGHRTAVNRSMPVQEGIRVFVAALRGMKCRQSRHGES